MLPSIISRFRMQYNVILHASKGNFNVNQEWKITIYLIKNLVANYIIIFNIIQNYSSAQYYSISFLKSKVQMFSEPQFFIRKEATMLKGELSAVIARLMSYCLWNGWNWKRGLNEIASPFPCCPVNREYLGKKTKVEKKQPRRTYLIICLSMEL